DCMKRLQLFRSHPEHVLVDKGASSPASEAQFFEPACPLVHRVRPVQLPQILRNRNERKQRVVQFVSIAHIRPCVLLHLRDSGWIKMANLIEHCRGKYAAHLDSASPALLQRSVVKISIGVGIKNLVREDRWNGSIDSNALYSAALDL